ncbi:metallophosphoesterase [uncultured Shewanella sp.]|uniref:metallophosphoesterase family protein n=1 Tax=uncultured Shewanella sp. TaxID=173975 RepID=UPI002616AC65|nr:metallophosphoesterase [uncultured Shewanella sp.]
MRIYQVSDCHLSFDDHDVKANLIQVLQHIERQADGDMLLLTGDLVSDPSIEIYTAFKAIIEAHVTLTQIYAIAGNHDDLSLMKQAFKQSAIQIKSLVRLDSDHRLLLIDSSLKPIETDAMPLGAGRVSKHALALLKKETRKQVSIVVIHHPVLNLGARWFTQIGIENHQAVINAIHPQTLAVISGHAHHYFKHSIKGSLEQIVSPATSYGFNHDCDHYEKEAVIGYMAYQFNTKTAQLTHQVCWVD